MRAAPLFLTLLGSLFLSAGCEPEAGSSEKGEGTPECDSPLAACSSECADLASDAQNCGSCGSACTQDELCSLGACVPRAQGCASGLTECSGGCVDFQSSLQHCGTCSSPCASGQSCGAGICGGDASGSGGAGSGGSSSGGSGSGGTGSGGGSSVTGQIFDECRFHFGTFRDFALDNAQIRSEIDFFIPGWMGLSDTFDQGYVCDDVKGVLTGKVPVVVAYVSAFYAKREEGLNDCNVSPPDLCTYGSDAIKQNLTDIIGIYESYAQGYKDCLPADHPIVFLMEPDWFQYTLEQQTNPMTPTEAGDIMSQYVQAMKAILPSAYFSMDISPWVPPNNGSDHGADWYSNFELSPFSLINTSGGGTEADNAQIRSTNNMTWAGVSSVTGRSILADTGYGVNGANEGHDHAWDNVGNINARIADGVIGVAQYNPESNWGATLANIRSQLDTPAHCP